jgi:hypothetical protein
VELQGVKFDAIPGYCTDPNACTNIYKERTGVGRIEVPPASYADQNGKNADVTVRRFKTQRRMKWIDGLGGDLPRGVKLSDMPAQPGVGDGDKHMKLWGKVLRGPPKEGVGRRFDPSRSEVG